MAKRDYNEKVARVFEVFGFDRRKRADWNKLIKILSAARPLEGSEDFAHDFWHAVGSLRNPKKKDGQLDFPKIARRIDTINPGKYDNKARAVETRAKRYWKDDINHIDPSYAKVYEAMDWASANSKIISKPLDRLLIERMLLSFSVDQAQQIFVLDLVAAVRTLIALDIDQVDDVLHRWLRPQG